MEPDTDHVGSPAMDSEISKPQDSEDKNGSHTPNDSEAETEILPGSQKPTPRKKPRVKEEADRDGWTGKDHEQKAKDDTLGGEERVVSSAIRAAASRKRKAEDAGVEQDHKEANGYHSDPKVNSSKKARLSSPEEQDQHVEDESTSHKSDSDEESGSGEEVIKAGRRRRAPKASPPTQLRKQVSAGEARRRGYNFRHPNDETSLRISTSAQTTTSPSSPTQAHPASAALHPRSPYLRSNHRRSSSFHSTALDSVPDEMALGYGARRFGSSAPVGEGESSGRSVSQPAPGKKLVDRIGRTPLARACSNGDIDKVKTLLQSPPPGLDFNRADNSGNTALQIAALDGQTQIVELLLEHGCEVNTVNGAGDTPLQDAMDNDHEEVVALLKAAGAREKQALQSTANQTRQRPNYSYLYTDHTVANLIRSIKERDAKTIDYLLRTVQPNIECLIAAIESHIPDLPSLLLAQKADETLPLHKSTNEQRTPIVVAIECGNNEAIELLLAHGANPGENVPGTQLSHDRYCLQRKASGYKQAYRMLFKAKKLKAAEGRDAHQKESGSPTSREDEEEEVLSDDEPPATKDDPIPSPTRAVKENPKSDANPFSPELPARSKPKASSPPAPAARKSSTPKSPSPRPRTPTPLREPTPPPPPPTEAELAAARAAARADYLATLPTGLAPLLGRPIALVPSSTKRTIHDFLPLYGVPLSHLGAHRVREGSEHPEDAIFVPSLYAVLVHGAETVEDNMNGRLASSGAFEMTVEEMEAFWRRRRLWDLLGRGGTRLMSERVEQKKKDEEPVLADPPCADVDETDSKSAGKAESTTQAPESDSSTKIDADKQPKHVVPPVTDPVPHPQAQSLTTNALSPPSTTPKKEAAASADIQIQRSASTSSIKAEREKFLNLRLRWVLLGVVRGLVGERCRGSEARGGSGKRVGILGGQRGEGTEEGTGEGEGEAWVRCDVWVGGRRVGFA